MQTGIEKEKTQESQRVGMLASGEQVYDRPNGHIHDTIKADLSSALAQIDAQGKDKVVETITLEGKQWKSSKVSIDPEQDKEDLFLARRTGRTGLSTFIRNKKATTTEQMVVILSKNDGTFGIADGYTVMTAFSGDMAPREPWDAYFTSGRTDEEKAVRRKEKEEALEYWSRHAFVPDEQDALKFPFLTLEEKEKQVVYTGLFVTNQQELLSKFPPKHEKIFAHHMTIEFMPTNTSDLDIGKPQQLKILGRVSDDQGDALLVENTRSKQMYPHITLSCKEGISASYSNQLLQNAVRSKSIEYFPEPIYIDVVEGFENGNKKVVVDDKYLVAK